jgi:hypothetical protein
MFQQRVATTAIADELISKERLYIAQTARYIHKSVRSERLNKLQDTTFTNPQSLLIILSRRRLDYISPVYPNPSLENTIPISQIAR